MFLIGRAYFRGKDKVKKYMGLSGGNIDCYNWYFIIGTFGCTNFVGKNLITVSTHLILSSK